MRAPPCPRASRLLRLTLCARPITRSCVSRVAHAAAGPLLASHVLLGRVFAATTPRPTERAAKAAPYCRAHAQRRQLAHARRPARSCHGARAARTHAHSLGPHGPSTRRARVHAGYDRIGARVVDMRPLVCCRSSVAISMIISTHLSRACDTCDLRSSPHARDFDHLPKMGGLLHPLLQIGGVVTTLMTNLPL